MDFTFGIITTPDTQQYLQQIVDSICDENIPNFEIIIVGGTEYYNDDTLSVIPHDESIKYAWTTRKKNIITEHAKYDNIVYLHDYIKLESGWYNGFVTFGDAFDICMTPMKNIDGTRFRDWTLWAPDIPGGVPDLSLLLPYNVTHLSKYMYISGAYWVAKKKIMSLFPLNEELSWGEGEDVEWSDRVKKTIDFSINTNSSVKLLKYKLPIHTNVLPETLIKLNSIKS